MNKFAPIISNTPPFSTNGGVSTEPVKPKSVSQSSWDTYMKIYNYAKKLGDPFPEVFATQSALESGWFKRESGKNNFFGIKARKDEEGTLVNTQEDTTSGKVKIKDKFKDYSSLEEGIKDRYNRFSKIYSNASNTGEAIEKLHKSSYATDKKYGEILTSMLKSQKVNLSSPPKTSSKTLQYNNFTQDNLIQNDNIYKVKHNKEITDYIKQSANINDNINKDIEKKFLSSQQPTSLEVNPSNTGKINADALQNSINPSTELQTTNPKAYGGNLNFKEQANGLNMFNTGGLHEQNPHGGIPMGMGENGKMNTVEEGEASFNIKGKKFIFSNRIKI